MKDEIKEILDNLKKISEIVYDFKVNSSEIKKVLDYITNLQEKVNQYENPDDMTLMFMWCDEKAKDKMKQLQEENEKLKLAKDTKCASEILCECLHNEYKSRCDKAIKIIKDEIEHCDSALSNQEYTIVSKHDLLKQEKEFCIKQLNILEGDDKE